MPSETPTQQRLNGLLQRKAERAFAKTLSGGTTPQQLAGGGSLESPTSVRSASSMGIRSSQFGSEMSADVRGHLKRDVIDAAVKQRMSPAQMLRRIEQEAEKAASTAGSRPPSVQRAASVNSMRSDASRGGKNVAAGRGPAANPFRPPAAPGPSGTNKAGTAGIPDVMQFNATNASTYSQASTSNLHKPRRGASIANLGTPQLNEIIHKTAPMHFGEREEVPNMFESTMPQDDYWVKLYNLNEMEYRKREASEKAKRRKQLMEQEKMLDEQVQLRKTRKEEERKRDLIWRELLEKDKVVWLQETAAVQRAHEAKVKSIKHDREEMVDLKQNRKRREVEEAMEYDRQIMTKMKKEIEEEQEVMKVKKEEARIAAKKFAEWNAEQKKYKAIEIAQRQKEELEYNKKYDEKLERQERARAQALQEMKEKSKIKDTIAFELQETLWDKAQEDERKAEREQEKRWEQVEERHRQMEAKKKRICEIQRTDLEGQMAEREEAKKKEREEFLMERDGAQSALEEAVKLVEEEKIDKRKRIWEQRDDLVQQMLYRNRLRRLEMTENERRFNLPLFSRAEVTVDPAPSPHMK